MGLVASQTWTFSAEDGGHVVGVNVTGDGWGRFFVKISVDNFTVCDEKGVPQAMWREYPLKVGRHVGVVRVFRKSILGGTGLELKIDGAVIPDGRHVIIAQPAAPRPAPVTTPPPAPAPVPVSATPSPAVPMVPAIPPNCAGCGAPLSMGNIQWTGPMTAKCPNCSTAFEIQWRKIGG